MQSKISSITITNTFTYDIGQYSRLNKISTICTFYNIKCIDNLWDRKSTHDNHIHKYTQYNNQPIIQHKLILTQT